MFTNVQYGSTSDTEAMDVCSVQENCAWVIDGSDALFPTHITEAAHDGEWFVKELNIYLKQNLSNQRWSIADIMYQGMKHIHRRLLSYPIAQNCCDLEFPNACCAVIRIMHSRLYYFILGNCELIITHSNGTIDSYSDLRLQELDAKLLELSREMHDQKRMPLFTARNFMDHLLVENRLRRNIEGGYYVLGEDATVVKHALTGSLPLHEIKSISLVCNGFSKYYNCKKVTTYLEQYLKQERSGEFVELYESMLMKKNKNEKLARYMQESLSGQSTVVFFDVHEASKINYHHNQSNSSQ